MKIIFMGTPSFAAHILESLINNGYEICLVVTKPDKPVGRKQILTASEVKMLAKNYSIETFEPDTLSSDKTFNKIANFKPDLIVVVAYGKILPESILKIPKFGCINVHGSLLPKYRGASPIEQSIINGEMVAGITTIFMDKGMDTGDILLRSEVKINENETAGCLKKRLAHSGAQLLIKTIKELKTGKLKRIKQDDSKATYCYPIQKSAAKINWSMHATQIHNLILGMNPSPVAFTTFNGKNFKIYLSNIKVTKPIDFKAYSSGEVINLDPFIVACGKDTVLEILEVQIEGKRKMVAKDFVRGIHYTKKIFLGA